MIRHHLIFWFVLYFLSSSAFAQLEGKFKENCLQVGAENYIFGTLVNVREYMSVDTDIIAKLPIGTKIKILEFGYASEEINGFWSPWVKIQFQYKKEEKEGYVLAAMLSASWLRNELGTLFLVSASQFTPKNGATIQVRVVHKHQLLASQDFIPWETTPKATGKEQANFDGLFISSKLMDSKGLDSLQNVIAIRCVYNHCTFANEDWILLWDGKQLVKGFTCYFGGIPPALLKTNIIFPIDAKKGEKNKITLEVTEKEPIYDKNGNETSKEKVNFLERSVYEWKNKTLIKMVVN